MLDKQLLQFSLSAGLEKEVNLGYAVVGGLVYKTVSLSYSRLLAPPDSSETEEIPSWVRRFDYYRRGNYLVAYPCVQTNTDLRKVITVKP